MVLGKVTIALNIDWHEPRSNSTADILAAERAIQFEVGAAVDTACLNTVVESYHIGSEVVIETAQCG
jgi:beta-glucosidase/6-phospho-beta-glucosidase/beta-galactosidase